MNFDMKTNLWRTVLLCLGWLIFVGSVSAQDLGAVRQRMEDRLPELDRLKAAGTIGETNVGFVELRTSKTEAAETIAAENDDRKVVYAAIARQAGASAYDVARARARQIAAGSASGVWIQSDEGEWYRKR
jgi:uncharacterized protein YdbL (DUF1318 family)